MRNGIGSGGIRRRAGRAQLEAAVGEAGGAAQSAAGGDLVKGGALLEVHPQVEERRNDAHQQGLVDAHVREDERRIGGEGGIVWSLRRCIRRQRAAEKAAETVAEAAAVVMAVAVAVMVETAVAVMVAVTVVGMAETAVAVTVAATEVATVGGSGAAAKGVLVDRK